MKTNFDQKKGFLGPYTARASPQFEVASSMGNESQPWQYLELAPRASAWGSLCFQCFFEDNKMKKMLIILISLFTSLALAEEGKVKVGGDDFFVGLTPDKPYIYVLHEGSSVKIQRIQDPNYVLSGYFAKTIRKCPPFCIQPITPDPRVKTVGEVEIFDFLENQVRNGTGLLIDARTKSWHKKGTIPGSVNIPFTQMTKDPDSPEIKALFKRFGAKPRHDVGFFTKLLEDWGWIDNKYLTDKWDFTNAKELVLYCNGPSCGQSPRAIRGLLKAGYPADKIFYYRGGMQLWELWGLTTVLPKEQ